MDLTYLSVLFGGGSSYKPPPPPAVATEDDAVVKAEKEAAAQKERDLARKRKGRRSTINTTAQGFQGPAPNLQAGGLTGTKTKLGQ